MFAIYISNAVSIGIKIIGGLFLLQAFVGHLGQDGLGLASQYQSIITVIYGVFNALIFNYAVKNQWSVRVEAESFTSFLVWVVKLSICLALVVGALSWPLSLMLFNDSLYMRYMIFAAVQMPLVAVYIALSAKMCADNEQIKYNLLVAVSTSISMFSVWYYAKSSNMDMVLTALAFFYLPAFIVQSCVGRFELKSLLGAWCKEKIKYDYLPVMRISFVAVVSAFLSVAVQITIRKIIFVEAGWDAVGEWQIVNKISESYLLLASIPIFTFFLPKYVALKSVNQKKSLMQNIVCMSIFIVAAAGGLIYLAWPLVTKLIIGQQFNELQNVFGIQVLGDIFKIWCWVLVAAALGDGQLKLVLLVELLFAAMYSFLIYIYYSKYGLGASVACYGFIYFIISLFLTFIYIKKFNEK